MALDPESRLLQALRILHRRGYEGLKAYADIDFATGRWRSGLGVIGRSAKQVEAMGAFHYTSASGWRFFDRKPGHPLADTPQHSPEWAADMLSVRFPDLMQAALIACKSHAV